MKKLILVALLLPFTASAAWWNPLTWFDSPSYETASVTEIPVVETEEPKTIEVIKEVPVETVKEVVKTETVTVQDPALQARINQLISENASLRAQVASLTGQISTLQSTIDSLNNRLGQQVSTDEYQEELARQTNAEREDINYRITELQGLQSEISLGKYVYGPNHSGEGDCLNYPVLPSIISNFSIAKDSDISFGQQYKSAENNCFRYTHLSEVNIVITSEINRLKLELLNL